MEGFIALSAILLLLVLAVGIRLITARKKTEELEAKTKFSVGGDSIKKVVFEEKTALGGIAQNFNAMVDKTKGVSQEFEELKQRVIASDELDKKLKGFEDSLMQMNLLTEIGKKITGNLDAEEILLLVHDYLKSSMDLLELELLYHKNDLPLLLNVDVDDKLNTVNRNDGMLPPLMAWAMQNQQEVLLNDAERDFKQYVAEPVESLSGFLPKALMCIPMWLHGKPLGAIAVTSSHKEVFSEYHLNFLRTIASYLAVALDNSNVYALLASSKEEVELEKKKADELLLNILPTEVAEELKETGKAEAKEFEAATVLFTDFKGFTSLSSKLSATELVEEINACFKAFDGIMETHGLEKIKTIGDAYMAAGGLRNEKDSEPANVIKAGLDMQSFIQNRKAERDAKGLLAFEMRVGIHTGPVIAGVVGVKKFQYDIWGDTVNTASRMESSGETSKVNISEATYNLVKHHPEFDFEFRGGIEAKGKGTLPMWFVKTH